MVDKRSVIFLSIGASVAAVVAVLVAAGAGLLTSDRPAEGSFTLVSNAPADKSGEELGASSKQETLMSLISGGSSLLGKPDAPLLMIEFGDYQCLNCNRYFKNTEHLVLEKYVETGKLKVVFIDFAFIGPDSAKAAQAAHCANDQNRYWEYHDDLYSNWNGENTGWASTDNLKRFASNIGLERGAFDQCLDSGKYAERVETNYQLGTQMGVTGTPTFFIIGGETALKIVGAQPFDVFERVLDSGL